MKKVTGDMPSLNLVPAFEKIKAQCRSNKKIQNLEIPKIVGGEVQMLIGIKYQSSLPKHLHTFNNGLTVWPISADLLRHWNIFVESSDQKIP